MVITARGSGFTVPTDFTDATLIGVLIVTGGSRSLTVDLPFTGVATASVKICYGWGGNLVYIFHVMKIPIGRSLVAFLLCGASPFVFAGPFKSKIITSSPLTTTVPDGRFLRVSNFTQQGGVDRGVVSVTLEGGQTANVLAASRIDLSSSASVTSSPPEVINRVTIAGPAQVTVAPVLGATLFITYRKGDNESEGTVVVVNPTPTPTPTATSTPTATPTPTP